MKTCLIILTVALAGSGSVFAQQENQKENIQEGNKQPAVQNEQSTEELKVTDQELAKRVSEVNKASKFIGMKVKNPRNEDVGKVSDLALDLKSGRIAYAVVSVGGFLGIGDKLVAVPIEALTIEKGADHLLLDVDKQQVEQAAGFAQNNWPDLDAVKAGKTIGFTAKADTSTAEGGTGTETEQAAGADQQRGPTQPVTSIQAISGNADPATLHGKQVRLSNVKVHEVLGGNFATVGSAQGQEKVLLKTQTGGPQLTAGQTVTLTGTIRAMPSDPVQLGIDANVTQKIQGQRLYIDAGQVTAHQK